MDISNVIVSNDSFNVQVSYRPDTSKVSPKLKIHFIEYQLKAIVDCEEDEWWLLIKLKKCVDDDISYISKVNSNELKLTKTFNIDDNNWHVLGRYPTRDGNPSPRFYFFIIEISISIKFSSYLRLAVEDDSTTDFEIKGIDGSIRVHKVVLAAASEVFKQMVTNDFREKYEAQVELPYSKCVLQDFKHYIYLNTLNNDNLESLFMLAHCYMMDELKRKCIIKLFFMMGKTIKQQSRSTKNH